MIAKYGEAAKRGLASGPAYEKADVPDTLTIDGYNTLSAIETMKQMVGDDDKPFFLGDGLQAAALELVCAREVLGPVRSGQTFRWRAKRRLPQRRGDGAARFV